MLKLLLVNVFKTRCAYFRHGRLFKKKRALFTLLGLAILPVLIFAQTKDMFAVWLRYPNAGEEFLQRFVSTSFLGVLIFLVLTGLPNVLHHFFLAPDLVLLTSLPIGKKQIYTQKLVEAAANNLGMYVAFGLPLLLSMSYVLHASPIVYGVIIIASFLFILIPTGLAAVCAFLLAGLFSVKKMRRFATLILGFFIIFGWAVLQFVRLSRLNPLAAEFEPEALMQFSNSTLIVDRLLLPSDWIVTVVHAASNGQVIAAMLNLGLLALLSALLIGVTINWRARLASKEIRIDASTHRKAVAGPAFTFYPFRLAHALFSKDNRLLFRDPRFLQSTLLLMVMFVLAPWLTRVETGTPQGTFDLFLPYVPVTILSLIAASLLARQAVPIERLSFVFLLQAPLTARAILLMKTLRIVLILTPFALISLLIAGLKTDASAGLLFSLATVHVLLILCGTMLGLTSAVSATHFDWIDPRYMMSPSGHFIGTFLTLLCGGLGIGLFYAGLELGHQIIAFVLFFIYVSVVFGLSLHVAQVRLSKLEWTY
ncbi:hypothetical protein EH223_04105 [candidate division KSB1 bacterium]|nr:hypothetical protein [candidate division KSB1 bacterium]RQW05666.1 MAG: hypothetical protein EH223_04105 [candidate division KSB1 bacterium]